MGIKARDNFKFVVAPYVLFERDDKVLLLRRHNTGWADGWFTLPAGHVERGEGFIEAAIREAQEEVGVAVRSEDLLLFHVSHHVYNQNEQCIDFFFRAKKWDGDLSNQEPHKCDLVEWYAKNKLPQKVLRNVRTALEATDGLRLKEFPLIAEEHMAAEKTTI